MERDLERSPQMSNRSEWISQGWDCKTNRWSSGISIFRELTSALRGGRVQVCRVESQEPSKFDSFQFPSALRREVPAWSPSPFG